MTAVSTAPRTVAARRLGRDELAERIEAHRPELLGYCYRMLGSVHEADDAVQETFLRAWRGYHRFEGRSELRSWLYRIATNVCLDGMAARRRRALPADLGAAGGPSSPTGPARPEATWIEPVPDAVLAAAGADPAEQVVASETIRLAFVAALQHLPPRQRAVLILRDVLRWRAGEVAELLATSVAAVNSALQRARATMAAQPRQELAAPSDVPPDLLARYVEAFERYDIGALVALLREDATWTMPPFELWLAGAASVAEWLGRIDAGCRDLRFVPTQANGAPAFALYHLDRGRGTWEAFGLQVLDVAGGAIAGVHTFLDSALVGRFGLSPRLE